MPVKSECDYISPRGRSRKGSKKGYGKGRSGSKKK